MSSPAPAPVGPSAPLLRPPRTPGAARTPRLGLSIPPSPGQKAVDSTSAIPALPQLPLPRSSQRPTPPQLRLATPKGTNSTPSDVSATTRTSSQQLGRDSASDASAHSRTGSFGMLDDRASGPSSASSASHSALSFTNGNRQTSGTPDPASAISSIYSHEGGTAMDREISNHLTTDLEKLTLSLGREPDVDDLDDNGWLAASKAGKIQELSTLGEGAGGAVTKCRLTGGKTVFALKVCISKRFRNK